MQLGLPGPIISPKVASDKIGYMQHSSESGSSPGFSSIVGHSASNEKRVPRDLFTVDSVNSNCISQHYILLNFAIIFSI